MKKVKGTPVFSGITRGPIMVMKPENLDVTDRQIADVDAEMKRLREAMADSKMQINNLYDLALQEVGEVNAAIFEVHAMMLEDEDFLESIESMIKEQKHNAEYAVWTTGINFSEMFASMDDEYMKARSIDVKDISTRLVRNLLHLPDANSPKEPMIYVADDLTPSQTLQLDKSKILAFVTVHGSKNSHTSILARMMSIPAIIGLDVNLDDLTTGTEAIVNGFSGEVVFEPDAAEIAAADKKMESEKSQRELLKSLKGKPNKTKSGKTVDVFANIGGIGDVGYAIENDAGGVGLFRSEFLYIGRKELPKEEEQFEAYRKILQLLAGKKVVIRTMDIGADKKVEYLNLGQEENPALGCRAIRICLTQPEIFKTQLRALFRAAVFGNLSIMYPMIISVEEVDKIHEIADEVAAELKREGVPFRVPEQGIMIETPAAAVISDKLAPKVDFFSVGTNDLTQYTLACDRQNAALEPFINIHHEAVLRLIETAANNAHKCGKWIGICGELAADPALTKRFMDMGIDELSMAPSMILKIRKVIMDLD